MEYAALSTITLLGILISYFDFRERRVPNLLVTLIIASGIFFVILQGCNPWLSLWCVLGLGGGALLIRILFYVSQKKEVLGMGDIKLLGALGLWLQPLDIPAFLFFTGLAGAVTGIAWVFFKKEKEFPFAPAIIAGYLVLRFLKYNSMGSSGILC